MSCWTKEQLENMLYDVVNELDLSESAIEYHGPLGTPPAELVRLVIAQKDKHIKMLKYGMQEVGQKRKGGNEMRKFYEFGGFETGGATRLTPEQLLIPRVMCIGTEVGTPNYPGSNWDTGDVLTYAQYDKTVYLHKYDGPNIPHIWFLEMEDCEKYLKQFSHLFRPMPWYEGRKPEEMPEYVTYEGQILKVNNWIVEDGTVFVSLPMPNPAFTLGNKHYSIPIPATEAEYLTYKGYRKCPDCDSVWGGNERCPECFPL